MKMSLDQVKRFQILFFVGFVVLYAPVVIFSGVNFYRACYTGQAPTPFSWQESLTLSLLALACLFANVYCAFRRRAGLENLKQREQLDALRRP